MWCLKEITAFEVPIGSSMIATPFDGPVNKIHFFVFTLELVLPLVSRLVFVLVLLERIFRKTTGLWLPQENDVLEANIRPILDLYTDFNFLINFAANLELNCNA